MRDFVYLVLPAYNEEENIKMTIAQWHPIVEKIGNGSKLLIANDGSKDNTYQIMLSLQKEYPLLVPIDKLNSGHGATLLYLYNQAIVDGVPYIFQTDSDGQTEPNEFWPFWTKRKEYDFIIGTRRERQDGLSRVVVTTILRWIVSLIFGVKVPDSNTPFRLMNTTKLVEILQFIPKDFFLSNVVVSAIAVRNNYKCDWQPITFKPRQGGVNSINIKRIIGLGFKAIGDFITIKRQLKDN